MKFFIRSAVNVDKKLMLLSTFGSSLVNLKISYSFDESFIPQDLSFPILKSLEFSDIGFNPKILKATKALSKLMVRKDYVDEDFIESLMKLKTLEHLKLYSYREHFFQKFLLEDAKFTLKSIEWLAFENIPLSIEARTNFDSTMVRISQNLTYIHISICFPEDINLVVNQMPVLKKFQFFDIQGDSSLLKLNPNTTITDLIFYTLDNKLTERVSPKNVISSLVNLENLIIHRVDDESSLDWIIRRGKKLKKLNTWSWRLDPRIFYQKLKTSDPSINQNIEINGKTNLDF